MIPLASRKGEPQRRLVKKRRHRGFLEDTVPVESIEDPVHGDFVTYDTLGIRVYNGHTGKWFDPNTPPQDRRYDWEGEITTLLCYKGVGYIVWISRELSEVFENKDDVTDEECKLFRFLCPDYPQDRIKEMDYAHYRLCVDMVKSDRYS